MTCHTAGAATRPHLERLLGYAPQLNADEEVWNLVKRAELRKRCCQDLDELRLELGLNIRRLHRKVALLTACFRRCGYIQSLMWRPVKLHLHFHSALTGVSNTSGIADRIQSTDLCIGH